MKVIPATTLTWFVLCTFCMLAPSLGSSHWGGENEPNGPLTTEAFHQFGPEPRPLSESFNQRIREGMMNQPDHEDGDGAMETVISAVGTALTKGMTELDTHVRGEIISVRIDDPNLRGAYDDIIKKATWLQEMKDSGRKIIESSTLPQAAYVAGVKRNHRYKVEMSAVSEELTRLPTVAGTWETFVDSDVILVGRKLGVDLRFPAFYNTVSRVHVIIYVYEHMTLVVDRGSRNGFSVIAPNAGAVSSDENDPKVFLFEPDESFTLVLPYPDLSKIAGYHPKTWEVPVPYLTFTPVPMKDRTADTGTEDEDRRDTVYPGNVNLRIDPYSGATAIDTQMPGDDR